MNVVVLCRTLYNNDMPSSIITHRPCELEYVLNEDISPNVLLCLIVQLERNQCVLLAR